MAQTISIQRGYVTYTARGDNTTSNNTTLFTNTSSGAGTRVIINYLTVSNPYVAGAFSYTPATCSGLLASVSAGTTGTIIGGMQAGSSTGSFQISPVDAGSPVATGNTGVFVTTPRFRYSSPGNNQVGFTNINPNSIGFDFSDTTNYSYCPRSFWIGPSDVIRWFPKSSSYVTMSGKSQINNYYTQTLYYSFTCITES